MDIVVLDVFWRRCKYDLRKGDYMYVYDACLSVVVTVGIVAVFCHY